MPSSVSTCSTAAAKGTNRFPVLDLMRFLAAFSVLVYHYVSCYLPKLAVPEGFLAAASWATRYGYLGVNAFFMISGFVILWSAMQRGPIDFLIGRISRLYPCFWFSVLLTAGVVYLFGAYAATGIPVQVSPASVAANLTMIPSYLGFGYIDDVYWTLEVELRFYALVFLMLLFRLQNRVDSLLNLWLAILALGRFFDLPGLVGFVMIDGWGQYFVAGCLFFLGHKFGWTMGRIIALLVAASLCVTQAITSRSGFITPDQGSLITVPLIVAALFVAFGLLVQRPLASATARVAEQLGSLTYPLYLTHAVLGFIAISALFPVLGALSTVGAVTLGALILAAAMSRLVDTPGRRWLANWLNHVWRKLDGRATVQPR